MEGGTGSDFSKDKFKQEKDFSILMRTAIQPVYYNLLVVFSVFVALYSNNALICIIMLLHILNMKLGIWTHFGMSAGK